MTQPSEWARSILKARKQTERAEDIRAELRVRDERMFQSKAPESWQAIVEKLRADCGLLNCQISDIPMGQTMGQPSVRLQGSGPTIRIVTARFDLDGHQIKIVKSHIKNGVEGFDGKEFIALQMSSLTEDRT